MEGGIHKAEKTEFKECLNLTWKQPYILRLAFSAGIGGLLFGYDTGVISGALLYIRDDFNSVDRSTVLQETIVSMAVAGAIIGAGFGGWLNDRIGRRPSIIFADLLFFIGALVMAVAPTPGIIILGRIFVGFGVGMASMTSPLYISEASPAKIRGALDRKEEAAVILRKIYPANEVDREIEALRQSVEAEIAEEGSIGGNSFFGRLKKALSSVVVRRGLVAGIICQVAQQFVGINTVMYYSPTIVQLAGFASNSTALALSLITSGLNAIGSIVSMYFVDRAGRRRLLLVSLIGIMVCLACLSGVFFAAATHSPAVGEEEARPFGNFTCPDLKPDSGVRWKCMDCVKATAECGFCAHAGNKLLPGACLVSDPTVRDACHADGREWYTRGCPSNFGWLALIALGAYIISYSPGMGTVPWIINSEIYPLRFRGICGGLAAVANWVSNLIVSQTFLSLTEALGTAPTFLLYCGVSVVAFVFIFLLVPETKGLQFEQVEKMLESKNYRAWKKSSAKPQTL
ncbi:hypothetical protein ZIOFF_041429 [Zingiber officinale]|uniref:Major facilitator superfamily (MFS) profile domain-containing protein n=1 Tax=Zingiber officinale TaxID=94328 RepID=A0A8J5KW29_ZINOF|nr:hypothetical protein ZIOFF_041429 [Zingiber officinale]